MICLLVGRPAPGVIGRDIATDVPDHPINVKLIILNILMDFTHKVEAGPTLDLSNFEDI
jgi:hypothetical protein